MKDRLEVIQARYDQISKDLLDINIVSDIKKMTALSKEQRSLEKTVEKYQALLACEKNISELKELVHDSDPDIREMAEMELTEAQELLNTINVAGWDGLDSFYGVFEGNNKTIHITGSQGLVANDVSRNMENEIAYQRDITDQARNTLNRYTEE